MDAREELESLRRLAELEEKAAAAPKAEPAATGDTLKNMGGFALESLRKAGAAGLRNWRDMGSSVIRGGTSAIARDFVGAPDDPVTNFVNKKFRGLLDKGADAIDVPDDGSLWDKAMRGAGAGASLPVPIPGPSILRSVIATMKGNAVPGAVGGITAELAGRGADKITDTKESPKVRQIAELVGGALGGGATGWLAGPKQSVAQSDTRRALAGENPASFANAQAAAQQAREAGITTLTAPEAFEANSGIRALGANVRGGAPDNPLRAQTADRPGEIQRMAEEFLNRVNGAPGRRVDPNQTANAAGEAATSTMQTTKALRDEGIRNRLANAPPIAPHDVADVQTQLTRHAASVNSPAEAAAFRQVANALRGQHGLLTNVQDLSIAITRLRSAAANPQSPLYQSGSFDRVDISRAIDAARDALSQHSPHLRQALGDFEAFSNGPMATERTGPIGTLADKNPLIAGQTPTTKLEGVVSGNSQPTVGATARTLNDPTMTGGATVHPTEIAAALAQQKLRMGPTDPGRAVRGTEGSPAQGNFEELLRAGGRDPGHTMAPLAVADRLQDFSGPAGIHELPRQWLGPRVLRNIDMLITGKREATVNRELGELLRDSSPEGIRRLQELAMFSPAIRKMLSAKSAALPLTQQEE